MSLSQQDVRDLEMHSQVRETIEMQNTVLRLTVECFNQCAPSSLNGALNDTERECLNVCSSRFWQFFKRAQSNAQEVMRNRIQEQMQQFNKSQ
jgi:hypothetical protein